MQVGNRNVKNTCALWLPTGILIAGTQRVFCLKLLFYYLCFLHYGKRLASSAVTSKNEVSANLKHNRYFQLNIQSLVNPLLW